MSGREIRPGKVRGVPSQAQPPAEERQRQLRSAELMAMDRFWDEIVPACQPFHATVLEKRILVTDPRLFRQNLFTVFGVEALSAIATTMQGSKSEVTSEDEIGIRTRITTGYDGTLHISKYLPGLGGARDTIDVYYKKEDTGDKLRVETREHMKIEEGPVEPVEREVILFFNNQELSGDYLFGDANDVTYGFWGRDNYRKEIHAQFIEREQEVWGEIGENKRQ